MRLADLIDELLEIQQAEGDDIPVLVYDQLDKKYGPPMLSVGDDKDGNRKVTII